MKRLFLLMPFLSSFAINAQDWFETQKVVASDRDTNDHFGVCIAISGNYALSGANREDENVLGLSSLEDAGASYFYEQNSLNHWSEVQKVVPTDRKSGDWFGSALDMDGNIAIISSPQHDLEVSGSLKKNVGAAYIFERDEFGVWNEVQKLTSSDGKENDYFGLPVSISGNYAIVSSYAHDFDLNGENRIENSGAAYIFERDILGHWSEKQKLVSPDREVEGEFGWSVSVHGNYAIIGARKEDTSNQPGNVISEGGTAYIFERDTSGVWIQKKKLVAPERQNGDQFGYSVSIHNQYAVVGALFEDEDQTETGTLSNSGSAYIFERGFGEWSTIRKIVSQERSSNDRFGTVVAIENEEVIVGAPNKNDSIEGISLAGAAFIFTRNEFGDWNETQKILASDKEATDKFGFALDLNGGKAIIGVELEDEDINGLQSMTNSGSAYILQSGSTTSISEKPSNTLTSFKVYPNPTKDVVKIEISGKNEKKPFEIVSSVGQVVRTGMLETKASTINLSNLMPGFYMLNVKSSNQLFSTAITITD